MPWRYINAAHEVIHKHPWNQLVAYNHWTGMVEWNNGTAIALFSRSKVTYTYNFVNGVYETRIAWLSES